MSCLPLPETPNKTTVPAEFVLIVEKLDDAPITAKEIARWTQRDPLMSIVFRYISDGWPDSPMDELRPYWTKRLELTTYVGCILWSG